MSTLLIDELFDGVNFDIPIIIERNINIRHIRPWIYKEGTLVDGDFTCEVFQGATLLAASTINFATINAALTQDFSHGYMRFDFDSLSLKVDEGNTQEAYTVRFYMNNHITNLTNYISIVRNWETKFYDTFGDGVINNQAPNDSIEPGGIEIYELRQG